MVSPAGVCLHISVFSLAPTYGDSGSGYSELTEQFNVLASTSHSHVTLANKKHFFTA